MHPLAVLNATMDGSLSTMPRPRAKMQVLAVPRSMATSVANAENRFIVLSRMNETQGGFLRSRPALVRRRGAVAGVLLGTNRSALHGITKRRTPWKKQAVGAFGTASRRRALLQTCARITFPKSAGKANP